MYWKHFFFSFLLLLSSSLFNYDVNEEGRSVEFDMGAIRIQEKENKKKNGGNYAEVRRDFQPRMWACAYRIFNTQQYFLSFR